MSKGKVSILAGGPLACDELCAPLREGWLKLKGRPLNPCDEERWRALRDSLDNTSRGNDLFLACQWIAFEYAQGIIHEQDYIASGEIIRNKEKSGRRVLLRASEQLDELLKALNKEWPDAEAEHVVAAEGLRKHLNWLDLVGTFLIGLNRIMRIVRREVRQVQWQRILRSFRWLRHGLIMLEADRQHDGIISL